MYKDIISYQLADGTTEEHLLKIAGEVADSWMKQQPGFIKWEINSNKDGHFTDIVYWESEAAAQKAELAMANIPQSGKWYGCYKPDTIATKKLTQLAEF